MLPSDNSVIPCRLQSGDTIGALSPSWGGPSLYPHIFDLGLKNLRDCLLIQNNLLNNSRFDTFRTHTNRVKAGFPLFP